MISFPIYYIILKIVKISICLWIATIVGGNDKIIERIVPFPEESWNEFKVRVNNNLQNGSITIPQLEHLLNGYRPRFNVRDFRHEEHDSIMEVNFSKYSNKSLGYIKNNLFDAGIEVEKLNAVLGGLLRLIHFSKIEGSNFKINQKMNSYFRKRLKLNKKQVNYLVYMAQEYKIVKFEKLDKKN